MSALDLPDGAPHASAAVPCASPAPNGRGALSSDAPIPALVDIDEFINAVSGPAIRAAADKRCEQIVRNGHSRASDAEVPADKLLHNAARRLHDAAELVAYTATPDRIESARIKLEAGLALALAAWDRLALEAAKRGEQG